MIILSTELSAQKASDPSVLGGSACMELLDLGLLEHFHQPPS